MKIKTMKAFKAKKGELIPQWVELATATFKDKSTRIIPLTWGCDVRVFMMEDDTIVIRPVKMRKRQYLVKVCETGLVCDDLHIQGNARSECDADTHLLTNNYKQYEYKLATSTKLLAIPSKRPY